jgi:hypothetical protein
MNKYQERDIRFIDLVNNEYGVLADIPLSKSPHNFVRELLKMQINKKADFYETQKKIRIILDSIIEKKELIESEELSYFISVREELSRTYIVESGRLKKTFKARYAPYPGWFVSITEELIDFLSDPKTDLRRIKKCNVCMRYFIAEHISQNVCPLPRACKKERKKSWQRDYMRRKRDPGGEEFDPKYIR